MQEVGAENARGKCPLKMHAENGRAKKFPSQTTGILVNFERRWLGMTKKMKKMNVLNYQVIRFARNKNKSDT